jgi:hypothetical protein
LNGGGAISTGRGGRGDSRGRGGGNGARTIGGALSEGNGGGRIIVVESGGGVTSRLSCRGAPNWIGRCSMAESRSDSKGGGRETARDKGAAIFGVAPDAA